MPSSDNKFARQAQQRDKRVVSRDAPPSIEDQLARLEDDIRRLKVEFDIYFNGGSRRPPYDTKSRVESVIKRLADERSLTFAQRYLYNSLVARYTAFRELWRRTIQDREEGRDATSIARSATHLETKTADSPQATFVCADAHTDVSTVKSLYDALIEAKRRCGEATDDISFPQFHRMIAAKTDTLKERLACQRVCFSIGVEGGRISFKVKADK